ncbi:MAG: PEBP family protein [Rhodothermales bacterium]|nr:PEBP family protein [Rhodothermales bacterium]
MRITITIILLLTMNIVKAESQDLTVDIWVDNWFEMYVNGNKVLEDSVPITTERSFNAETAKFTTELPALIAIHAKDFKENDTGLEYIGTSRQQMGDGGMIFQIKDAQSGRIIAASDPSMRCLVIHHAPIDPACAAEQDPVAGQGPCGFEERNIPAGWNDFDFDDSAWPVATEYSEGTVRPKDGYDRIQWDSRASLVWSSDLIQDNTLLCRLVVEG